VLRTRHEHLLAACAVLWLSLVIVGSAHHIPVTGSNEKFGAYNSPVSAPVLPELCWSPSHPPWKQRRVGLHRGLVGLGAIDGERHLFGVGGWPAVLYTPSPLFRSQRVLKGSCFSSRLHHCCVEQRLRLHLILCAPAFEFYLHDC
jgi:hypothetical protein